MVKYDNGRNLVKTHHGGVAVSREEKWYIIHNSKRDLPVDFFFKILVEHVVKDLLKSLIKKESITNMSMYFFQQFIQYTDQKSGKDGLRSCFCCDRMRLFLILSLAAFCCALISFSCST